MQAKLDLNPDSSESCFCDTESGTIEPFVQIRFFLFAGTSLCNT